MVSLEDLAQTPVLLVALDFDGTLAPLVDVPMQARMGAVARSAIDTLAATPRTFVALVSGRMMDDLRIVSEHALNPAILLAGSHGAQYYLPAEYAVAPAPEPSANVSLFATQLAEELSGLENVWIERKPYGFVTHTRLATDDDAARAYAIVERFAHERLGGWRRRGGHDVVEYSERAEGKDAAIRALRTAVGASAVLFGGDDETDEDAMRALESTDLGVRVGPGTTAATIRVGDAGEMAQLLSRLAELRVAQTTS